jgi:Tfp pilus assembly protein PilF
LIAAQPSASQRGATPPVGAGQSPGSGKKKLSFTVQLGIAFALFITVIIVIEMQTRPAPGASNGQTGSQQSAQVQPQQDFTGQITMLENAVRADSGNTDALLQLANVLHDAKMFPRAIETYKQFLQQLPKHTDARVDLGICYFELGDIDTAVKEIRRAIAIDPKHQMAMFNLGVILLSAGKEDESKQWLQQTIDIDPQSLAGQRAREILHQH